MSCYPLRVNASNNKIDVFKDSAKSSKTNTVIELSGENSKAYAYEIDTDAFAAYQIVGCEGSVDVSLKTEKIISEIKYTSSGQTYTPDFENDSGEVRFHATSPEKIMLYTTKTVTDTNNSCGIAVTNQNGFEANTKVNVKEITGKEAQKYLDKVLKKNESVSFAKVLDITLIKDDQTIEPNETVDVQIDFAEKLNKNITVTHFVDNNRKETVDSSVDGKTIKFKTDSFSVYVITDAPDPAFQPNSETSIEDFTGPFAENGFIMSLNRQSATYYFTSQITNSDCIRESTDEENAAVWFFEKVNEDNDNVYIYTKTGNKKEYIHNKSGNLVELSETKKTAFEISVAQDGRKLIKVSGENKWLQHSNGGKGIRLYTDCANETNSRIKIDYAIAPEIEDDPYDFDGKTFGLSAKKTDVYAYAMIPELKTVSNEKHLKQQQLLIRKDPMNQNNILEIAQNSNIPMWTFESINGDKYYLKSAGKYLKVKSGELTLANEPDEYCVIRIVPGTDVNKGKIKLIGFETNAVISLGSNIDNGYCAYNPAKNNEWFNLFKESVYQEEDFKEYFAYKVGVSDKINVNDESEVIIYTRTWNSKDKKYEFYAIDHNGDLVQCYESGDSIVWLGADNNTMLWKFSEYYKPGTTVSNGYYDLQNSYSGKYLAPQLKNNQTLSDSPIGLNINGRESADYYSPILAWDDAYYDYAGLKVENGKLVSCPMAQSDTFYFAVMKKNNVELTKVDTVDHVALGLNMKMINFDTNDFQNQVLGDNSGNIENITSGLLSTNLNDNYPTASNTSRSLSELFSNAQDVNHLFVQSVYDSSGYFQFDSTENFAHLNGDKFDVYQQLGGVSGSTGTRKHGQFMPYNTLDPTTAHHDNPQNLTDIYGNNLSDNYPRKHETLHAFNEKDDFYFGMEASGGFMQTPSGKDSWGHDIIFEFVGDDDFWFYVDDELVLDIGGIHKAKGGSVNYATGEVVIDKTKTTLYDIFKKNYATRNNLSENSPQVTEYLNKKFHEKVVDGKTVHVFKDYSAHTIRIFYMERGAGASNLRMRFNLATVNDGEVLLKKEISGTDNSDFASTRFPFQFYYDTGDGEGYRTLNQKIIGTHWNVVYQNSSTKVPFDSSVTIDGNEYENVFYLKPGQTASFKVPDDALSYYFKECGVDSTIYNKVFVNDNEIEGVALPNSNIKDYEIEPANVSDRAKVVFSNHVDPTALRTLTITKKLFDENGNPLTNNDDNAEFTMRVRLGDDLDYYNQGDYYIKNPEGYYCYYDAATKSFKSIGVKKFSDLTQIQKNKVTFRTSPSGAVSKLPANHSIEIRDLLVGTKFKVDEEEFDIPVGYGKRIWTETSGGITKTYNGYKRVAGSYLISEGDTENSGVIRDNSNPHIEIHNQRGWGIRAEKHWSDQDFMRSHDDTYFAIYVNGTLLPGSVKKIDSYNYATYFFQSLLPGTSFSDYEVKEVKLTSPVTLPDGTIEYTKITPLEEEDIITLGGIKTDGTIENNIDYKVSYQKGTNPKARVDKITNRRTGGITINKTDMDGTPLAGAKFEIHEGNTLVGRYTSNTDGLVTNAYLDNGIYTLSEVASPSGYTAKTAPITISVNNGIVSVNGTDDCYEFDENKNQLTIKNKPVSFTFKKVDAETDEALKGAHFQLYKQITTTAGQTKKDYYPLMDDITSDNNGVIQGLDETLKPGTYYLVETQEPDGYMDSSLVKDVIFTVSPTNKITVDPEYNGTVHENETTTTDNYTVFVPNINNGNPPVEQKVKFVIVNENDEIINDSAVFDFSGTYDNENLGIFPSERWTAVDGILRNSISLYEGIYDLSEIAAPAGYISQQNDMSIHVTENGLVSDSSCIRITHDDDKYIVKIVYKDPARIVPSGIDLGNVSLWIILAIGIAGFALYRRKLATQHKNSR